MSMSPCMLAHLPLNGRFMWRPENSTLSGSAQLDKSFTNSAGATVGGAFGSDAVCGSNMAGGRKLDSTRDDAHRVLEEGKRQ